MIDTYAWVEYLIGSRIGTKAKDYIETGQALTPSIVLVELRKWYLREIEEGRRSEREMQLHFQFIESATEVVPLDTSLASKAGETDFLMKKRVRNWPIGLHNLRNYPIPRCPSRNRGSALQRFRGSNLHSVVQIVVGPEGFEPSVSRVRKPH